MTLGSKQSRIVLGRWDPCGRVPSLDIRDGKIRFLPGKGSLGQFRPTEADFRTGFTVEYRVELGDMYFEGDHAQPLARTVSVVEPNGTRKVLASGFVLYVSPDVAAKNLRNVGVPFRAVSFYVGKDGEEIEREISTSHSGIRLAGVVLLGLSNLLLGAVAGLFIHTMVTLIAVGAIPLVVLAIVGGLSGIEQKVALVKMLTAAPVYAGSYAATVAIVRFGFLK